MMIWSKQSHLSNGTESWQYTHSLELKSSESPVEQAFFSQVIDLPIAGSAVKHARFLLIANAKNNAIYVVHIGYDESLSAPQMDYVTEFTVKMPILSGTSVSLPDEDNMVKLYCVQPQVIQLNICECLPPKDQIGSGSISDSSSDSSGGSNLRQSDFSNIKAESAIFLEGFQKTQIQMLTKLDALLELRAQDVARVKGIEATYQMMEQSLKGIEKVVKSFKDNQQEIVKAAVAAAVDPLSAQVRNLVDRVNDLLTSNSKADSEATVAAEFDSLNARVNSLVDRVSGLSTLIENSKAEETRYRDEAKGSKKIADSTLDDFFERFAIQMDRVMKR